MANRFVNIYSDALFSRYSRLKVPCEKGSQNGWPYCQTETGLRIFQEEAERRLSATNEPTSSAPYPSPLPKPPGRLVRVRAFWAASMGAFLVICCVVALGCQARKRAQANAQRQDPYAEMLSAWGQASMQTGQDLRAQMRALNTSQAALATSESQLVAGLIKLSLVDTQLVRLASSQADSSRELAAAQVALAQETTNVEASLRQTLQHGLAQASNQSHADTLKLQAQIGQESSNLLASLRQAIQEGLVQAVIQSRTNTLKLQAPTAEKATSPGASPRQTVQYGPADDVSHQAAPNRVPGATNVPNSALTLPRAGLGATPAEATEQPTMAMPIALRSYSPEKLHTRLGTLKFSGVSPDKRTRERLFDNLDFQRAVQAYLLALPPVSMVAIREGLTKWGPANSTIPIFVTLVDSPRLLLMTNHSTTYAWMWIDLHNGPLVAEIPPNVSGMINDFWFHKITDLGLAGPDKGAGGKYLVVPPGYVGKAPPGCFAVRASTFEGFLGWSNWPGNEDQKCGVESIRKFTRVYSLSEAADPPANKFVVLSGQAFDAVAPADCRFWDYLNQVVQGEPGESLDPLTLGYYASIGIRKGMPFTPDVHMKSILVEAAAVGEATARAIAFHACEREPYYVSSVFVASWPPAPLPPWK